MKRFVFGLPLLFLVSNLLAQTPGDNDAAAATALAAAGGIVSCVISIVSIGIWLWVAIWIMKDAKRRQSPNATLVTVLGWLVWPIGLIVHLATRPKTIPGGPNP